MRHLTGRSIVAAGLTIGLDQLTKTLATARHVVVLNPGAALSLGHNASAVVLWSSVAALAVLFFWWPAAPADDRVLLAFVVGAGLSNLADRFTLGGVRDFLALGWFPIFNVADLILSVSIGWLLVLTLFRPPHHPHA